MSLCPTCDGFIPESGVHNCPPKWHVWRKDEDEGNAHIVYAIDSEDAAERWAEWDDWSSADYHIVGGAEIDVYVRRAGSDATPTLFHVSGEAVPQYSAREVP